MSKIAWIRSDIADDVEGRKTIVTAALESGFDTIVARPDDQAAFRKLGKYTLLSVDGDHIHAATADDADAIDIGTIIEVTSNKDIQRAQALMNAVQHLVIIAKDWKVIPLENLIAAFQKAETKLIVQVSTAEEARLFLETLEVGTDGIMLATSDINEIKAFRTLLSTYASEKVSLVEATITNVQPLGTGDRVCIDTCSLLRVGEGMLIGSQSTGMFFVHSETLESEYVNSRPFRVNAGPVHAYIMYPNGRTKYLSEVRSGDEVLVVDTEGATQTAIVGRVKIEKRPLMLIEAAVDGKSYTTILQNAETIRLVSGGKPVSIVDLKPGDTVLMMLEEHARHFGTAIKETIVET